MHFIHFASLVNTRLDRVRCLDETRCTCPTLAFVVHVPRFISRFFRNVDREAQLRMNYRKLAIQSKLSYSRQNHATLYGALVVTYLGDGQSPQGRSAPKPFVHLVPRIWVLSQFGYRSNLPLPHIGEQLNTLFRIGAKSPIRGDVSNLQWTHQFTFRPAQQE